MNMSYKTISSHSRQFTLKRLASPCVVCLIGLIMICFNALRQSPVQNGIYLAEDSYARVQSARPKKNSHDWLASDPLIIHILSSNPRSGSSYLGEMLSPINESVNLSSSYLFEPLRWLYFPVSGSSLLSGQKMKIEKGNPTKKRSERQKENAWTPPLSTKIKWISSFENCTFSDFSDTIQSAKARRFIFRKPLLSFKHQTNRTLMDRDIIKAMEHSCRSSKLRVIKHVRLRLSELLQATKAANVKIILLTRDPRAVINSVLSAPRPWHKKFSTPAFICNNSLQDLNMFSNHSGHDILHVKYEDLTDASGNEWVRILDFLKVPRYLRSEFSKSTKGPRHPRKNSQNQSMTSMLRNYYSTQGRAQSDLQRWRSQLPENVRKEIEADPVCIELFKKSGLHMRSR